MWNAETALTVVRAACDLRAPVILMAGPCELDMLKPAQLAAVIRAVADPVTVPVALHLDHGDTPQLVDECVTAGFTSVMLDYSARAFDENAAALGEVVRKYSARGITVEGELGAVGRVDNATTEGGKASTLTVPGEAAQYVRETGVDILAVSIGNAHGMYTALPKLDFGLLAELRDAARIPLVLHGGSGTPETDIRKAVSLGIAKINVASELCKAIRESFEDQWKAGRNKWLPMAYHETTPPLRAVIEKWIRWTGAEGKA